MGDIQGGSENSSGHFKRHFGSQITLKSVIQVHIQQMKPKLATKVSLITVCKGESSVHNQLFSIEERERGYLETRSRSNISGAYTY